MRGLSGSFMYSLELDVLSPVLKVVRQDATLCMEIRKNYVNIYYRGGNLLKVSFNGSDFVPEFDGRYFNGQLPPSLTHLPQKLEKPQDVQSWIDAIPLLKQGMDFWFGNNRKNEREFQQLLVRENNFCSSAKGTDYFICDIEYADNPRRFDLIAVRWPSSGADRKNNHNLGLSFIEMKYGDGALKGSAGILKHLQDMEDFLAIPDTLNKIKEEMKVIFNQKLKLGLIQNQKVIENFNKEKPEFIFILANHDPESIILKNVLDDIKKMTFSNFVLKFAVSNFMGYGLYQQNIYSIDEFMDRFERQIYCH